MSAPATILIAEDGAADIRLMEIAAREAGLENTLKFVTNGEDVLQYLEGRGKFSDRVAHPFPKLLVLDLQMPKMSGMQVLEWLQLRPDLKVPVVAFSGFNDELFVKTAKDLGAKKFFVKPNSHREMVKIMGDIKQMVAA